MVTTFCDEQVLAIAERLKGEDTSVLFTGLLTVTPASAGMVKVTASEAATENDRIICIGILLRWRQYFGAGSFFACFIKEQNLSNFDGLF
jgi:hypothetical protein